MKVVVTLDDGKTFEVDKASDVFLSVRKLEVSGDGVSHIAFSRSWGSNLRELVKELSEAVLELRAHMVEKRKEFERSVSQGTSSDGS